jgi:trimethylamine--corrinoid protein Co-methyltransferase
MIEMAEAAIGGSQNLKKRKPITFIASISSPLKLTRKFCEVVMASARFGFSTGAASMVMAGATGPVNLAGVFVRTNAEILAGIALTQLVQKGAPVIYGSYSTAMDLRMGTSPLGSPETALMSGAAAGLCRYYQLPCIVPGIMSDSKESGSQAAFEKALTGVSAVLAGANLIVGIGGLETGLTFDFGQAVLDDEMVRLIKCLRQVFEVTDDSLSADLIHEVGHFGEFLSHDSTLLKMKSLSQTHLFDRSNREDWENKGRPQSYAKALSRAIDILENHETEPLPESAVKQIQTIVEEAEKEECSGNLWEKKNRYYL